MENWKTEYNLLIVAVWIWIINPFLCEHFHLYETYSDKLWLKISELPVIGCLVTSVALVLRIATSPIGAIWYVLVKKDR